MIYLCVPSAVLALRGRVLLLLCSILYFKGTTGGSELSSPCAFMWQKEQKAVASVCCSSFSKRWPWGCTIDTFRCVPPAVLALR